MFDGHPLSYSYTRAEKLLRFFFKDRFMTIMPRSLHEKLYYFVAVDLQRVWQSRTFKALPTTYGDAKFVHLEGGNLAVLHQPAAIRSMDWLQHHGKCVDHIAPGPSTIDGAGEGAFAKRDLPRGTLVTGSPLQHIPHRSYLELYSFGPMNPKDYPDKRERLGGPIGFQIILNHCIGHPESTLLLFPYGLGVNYINHNSSRANVEIRWAANGTSGHDASWLELSPGEMEYQYSTHLGIDYFATKDIEKGEEMFLDYGDAWEQAWNNHVRSWSPSPGEAVYSAAEWNDLQEPLRIQEEQQSLPYPSNLQIRCHVHLRDHDWQRRNLGWARSGDDRFDDVATFYGLPCVVRDRNDKDDTYVVELSQDRFTFLQLPSDFHINPTRSGVPRDALFFADKPWTTDIHLISAFRHEIQLPERMMPDSWRNRVHLGDRRQGGWQPLGKEKLSDEL
jgi:hypothetical protein